VRQKAAPLRKKLERAKGSEPSTYSLGSRWRSLNSSAFQPACCSLVAASPLSRFPVASSGPVCWCAFFQAGVSILHLKIGDVERAPRQADLPTFFFSKSAHWWELQDTLLDRTHSTSFFAKLWAELLAVGAFDSLPIDASYREFWIATAQ
jgi:hypothetical protein